MNRTIVLIALVGVASFVFTACDGVRDECRDGVDNDNDGTIDGGDPGCQFIASRGNALGGACARTDTGLLAADPACQVSATGQSESDDPQCFDRVDNDGDGQIDLDDLG